MINIKAQSIDILENKSYYTYQQLSILSDMVKTPSIITPQSGSSIPLIYLQNISLYRGLPIISSTYNGNGVHISTEYKICRDIMGKEIIADVSLNNVINYTFPLEDINELKKDKNYYLFVRYKSDTLGWSNWSDPCTIQITDHIYAKGVLLFRHHSNQASVLRMVDERNNLSELLVVDSILRQCTPMYFGMSNSCVTTPCKLLDPYRVQDLVTRTIYTTDIDGVGIYSKYKDTPLPNNINVDHFRTYWPKILNIASSRKNTDTYLNYNSFKDTYTNVYGCPPANYCRTVSIDHLGKNYKLDLPNIYKGMVIWAYADYIDILDPNYDTIPTYRLGCTNPNGRLPFWCSPDNDTMNTNAIFRYGMIAAWSKYLNMANAVPVLELDQI